MTDEQTASSDIEIKELPEEETTDEPVPTSGSRLGGGAFTRKHGKSDRAKKKARRRSKKSKRRNR